MKIERKFKDIDNDFVLSCSTKFNISPKIMEIIISRGYDTEEKIFNYLNPTKLTNNNPFLLTGMKEAKELIIKYVNEKKKILIFGDYDVDGVSASAIMIKMFQKLNTKVNYFLPSRNEDGYGMTKESIDKVINMYNPELIITVDCGISCYNEVNYLKDLGIEVIVTDHHELPEILPNCIIVNAKLPNQEYQFKELCGTGVAYKLSEAILGSQEAEEFLPIVAIATIADIVPLVDENRILVAKGLKLASKYLPYGIKHLISNNGLKISNLTANDVSFKIAPKLNASGRMSSAEDSLKLYLETNPIKVVELINTINNHNLKRQEICNDIYCDAKESLKKYNMSKLNFISLYNKDWNCGVLGIVCAKLVEEYNRPVFLFTQEDGKLKGSARSLNNINIHTVLSNLKDILVTFGGHSMAAGLTLDIDKYGEFVRRLKVEFDKQIDNCSYLPIKYYDVDLSLQDVNYKLYESIQKMEPCGLSNARPQFNISCNKMKINPLKKFPQHAEIDMEKCSFIMFNYDKHIIELESCQKHNFIVEFQSCMSNGKFKGIVINHSPDFKINNLYNNYFKAIKLDQLGYNDEFIKFSTCTNINDLISSVTKSCMGTALVSYSVESFNDYINKNEYETYNKNIFNTNNLLGFNTIILCPKDYDWVCNYQNIVFIDNLLDSSFISQINKMCDAKIYLSSTTYKGRNICDEISIGRDSFAKFYRKVIKQKIIGNSRNIFNFYEKLNDKNLPFVDYYFKLKVFNELKIIDLKQDDYFTIQNNENVKNDLNNSKIYNFMKLIKRL